MKPNSCLKKVTLNCFGFRRLRRISLSLIAAAASLFFFSSSALAQITGRVFAPYIDMSLSNNNLPQMSQASGIKYFTLAFIVSNGGCQAGWGGLGSVSSDTMIKPLIDGLRSQGGDVIISFGGAAGSELAVA